VYVPRVPPQFDVEDWERHQGDTVAGDVRVLRGKRDLYAYLPPSHGEPGRRFPVVYMHDGLNLFDETLSNDGEWRVDETMEELARERIEAIVVAIPHGPDRRGEYAGAGAEAYLRYLVDNVLPLIESSFAVEPGRASTGLAGSSLGGVISLQGLFAHPEVFGFAGVFSPAFWWNDDAAFELVERTTPPPARIYMDVGDQENAENEPRRRAYVDGFERMTELLRRKGYGEAELRAVLDHGGIHHESAWARRFPDAMRFLLGA
jgi:predicted alpha/beta superfamily hydrolase